MAGNSTTSQVFPSQPTIPIPSERFESGYRSVNKTLEALNREWNGAFWSNQYSDWSQIHFPTNSAEGGWQPAITLAYRQFFSDSFLDHLRRQAVILCKAMRGQFISTNWPSPAWSVNVFEAATEFPGRDRVGQLRHRPRAKASFSVNISRDSMTISAGAPGRNHGTSAPNRLPMFRAMLALKDCGCRRTSTWLTAAMGNLYFEWRRPLAGNEQYRPSFIQAFDGSIEPKSTFQQIGAEFARLGPRLAAATTRSDIALLYNFDNEWSQGFGSVGPRGRPYNGEMMHYYTGVKVLQRNVDIVPFSADFSGYKLIVAPNLHLIDDRTVTRLREFVAGGGILVLQLPRRHPAYGCQYETRASARSLRRDGGAGRRSQRGGLHRISGSGEGRLWNQLLRRGDRCSTRDTILESLRFTAPSRSPRFMEAGWKAGRRSPGTGMDKAGFSTWEPIVPKLGFTKPLPERSAPQAKLSPLIAAPYGVEVVSREDSDTTYYFLLNLTETAHQDIVLPDRMEDMIGEHAGITHVSLGSFEVGALALPKNTPAKNAT